MIKSKKIKIALNIIIIFSLILLLYGYLIIIFAPKDSSAQGGRSFYQGRGFFAEPDNSLDVMIFGNSNVYSGFNPIFLYNEYGVTSYASGAARQSVAGAYNLLSQALDNQTPQLVLIETNSFFDNTAKPASKFFDKLNMFAVPFENHSRWKTIQLKDFITMPSYKKTRDLYKGYVYDDTIVSFDPNDYMSSDKNKPIYMSKKNIGDVKKIVKLCDNKGVKVVFLTIPCANSWNYSKHTTVATLSNELNVEYYDLNQVNIVDWSKDTRDYGEHLNVNGAKKTTQYIFENILGNNISIGNLDDSVYKDWNENVNKVEKKQAL